MLTDLKLARRSVGWSQEALATRIGAKPQTVKRLEKGVGSVPTLIAAMTALNFRLSGLGPGASLPDQLRARRRKLSMSLEQAAVRAGLARATVAALERGGGSVASMLRLLAVLAPKVRRRAPERSFWGEGDKTDRDSRFTPPDFMERIYASFGDVDLDPCGHVLSPVIARRRILLSEGGDGMTDEWSGRLAFVNPPYSAQLAWLRRAHSEWAAGHVETILCLVPVRPDSAFFQDTLSVHADIYLLRGRVRFLNLKGKAQHTPFALMVAMFGATADQKARFSSLVPGLWWGRGADPTVSAP